MNTRNGLRFAPRLRAALAMSVASLSASSSPPFGLMTRRRWNTSIPSSTWVITIHVLRLKQMAVWRS